MGYTTRFTGEVLIEPPLNEAERDYLRRFAASRRMQRPGGPYALDGPQDNDLDVSLQNRPPRGQPSLNCGWVPNGDGRELVWDGMEKFYRSSGWMTYLIDTFLRPGAILANELRYGVLDSHPLEFADFTFDHTLNGAITASGQDGAEWLIEVVDNEVAVWEINGAAPTEYVVFVLPRHRNYQNDREFDAAYDVEGNQFSRFEDEKSEGFDKAVYECVRSAHPYVVAGDAEGQKGLVDDRIGLRVTICEGGIRIGLLADPALRNADDNFALVQYLVGELTTELGWIAVDPAQRVAVRPTAAFRERAIGMIRGWTEEPEGRHLWNVI